MTRLVYIAVPCLFVAAIAGAFAVLLVPRLELPGIGSIVLLVVACVLAGPYVIAAVTHCVDVLRGDLPPRIVDR